MNGFFASVELLDHPELRDVPMAVCGGPDSRRGIILAKNQLAKEKGVQTAETLWQAKKKCPGLRCVRPHMEKYKHYSRLINRIYTRYTDMVEVFSIDESWLDVTKSLKLFGDGKTIADSIRKTVREELSLTLSAGVSFNKFFAKMGSEYRKPDQTTVITRDNYQAILWPLPVEEMFFVGAVTAGKLRNIGIHSIGDLAGARRKVLEDLLGKQGGMLWDYANGMDDAPVSKAGEREKIKSVGNGVTFHRNLTGEDDISVAVVGLTDKVTARLRKLQLKATGVKVDIKDPGFHVIARQKQLPYASSSPVEISKAAMEVIKANWNLNKPIRLMTITAINLQDEDAPEQMDLFSDLGADREKEEKLDKTIDDIRKKFGDRSVAFGRVLGSDIGVDLGYHTEEK